MYIGEILRADSANGLGMRVSVFVSGCTNHCEGCFQPQTWDFTYGRPYTEEIERFILDEVGKPYYNGLTILGGEPFEESNQRGLIGLVRRFKSEQPKKNLWMFTGFVYDRDLVPGGKRYFDITDELLDHVDILVDGPFVQDRKNIALKFRGSENQRIIDLKKTRASGKIVLSPLNDETH